MGSETDNVNTLLTPGERALAGCGLLSFLVSLWAIGIICGCSTTDNTWRADGVGISVSPSSVMLIYGEVDKIPPGGYFERTRTVDLRPAWKRWFTDPDTNAVATSRIILDARMVAGATNATESVKTEEIVKQ